jgi:hypothetical protein
VARLTRCCTALVLVPIMAAVIVWMAWRMRHDPHTD